MASVGIGAKLRNERVGKGLAIDDISRDTRIASRFLEAIETDDYSSLPGLVFTRNFIRQYALTLQLDPDPLLSELPKPDETTAPLPDPPARPRSTYHRDRRMRAIRSSAVWLLVAGGAGTAAYMRYNHSLRATTPQARPTPEKTVAVQEAVAQTAKAAQAGQNPRHSIPRRLYPMQPHPIQPDPAQAHHPGQPHPEQPRCRCRSRRTPSQPGFRSARMERSHSPAR